MPTENRNEILKKVEAALKSVEKATEISIVLDHYEHLQTFEDLHAVPLGTVLMINGTRNEKILNEENRTQFKTTFPPGTEHDEQWHNCLEICYISSGELTDAITGETQSKKMDFPPFAIHKPANKGKAEMNCIVEFIRIPDEDKPVNI